MSSSGSDESKGQKIVVTVRLGREYLPSTPVCGSDNRKDRLEEAAHAVERVILRDEGTSWADEESDGPNFSESDREYLRTSIKSYVAAVDMVLTDGLNAEQVEAVICDGEIITVW